MAAPSTSSAPDTTHLPRAVISRFHNFAISPPQRRFTRFLAYRWRIRGIDGWYLAYRWRPLAETRHLGVCMLPLTTYCPNRPATYKRDTTGRPAKSAIYKPDIQPKPRPHAYTGTPARPTPTQDPLHTPRTHTTARGPAKSQVMSEKGHQKRPKQAESHPHPLTDKQKPAQLTSREQRGGHPTSKQPETSRIVPPSAHNRAKTVKTASHEQKGHQKRPKQAE